MFHAPSLGSTELYLFRYPQGLCSVKRKSGGLVLLRRITPLARRDAVYFYSGAYTRGNVTNLADGVLVLNSDFLKLWLDLHEGGSAPPCCLAIPLQPSRNSRGTLRYAVSLRQGHFIICAIVQPATCSAFAGASPLLEEETCAQDMLYGKRRRFIQVLRRPNRNWRVIQNAPPSQCG